MIVTDTTSTTLPVQTVTVPSTTIAPIRTVTPSRVTSTVIKTLWTIHRTVPTVVIQKQIKYVTASCSVPPRQSTPDITCQITPTILRAKALQTPVANKRALPGRLAMRQVDPEDLNDIPKFLADRRARLAAAGKNALVKRAPDLATMTVTDTKTADYITQTSTATAPTLTNIITYVSSKLSFQLLLSACTNKYSYSQQHQDGYCNCHSSANHSHEWPDNTAGDNHNGPDADSYTDKVYHGIRHHYQSLHIHVRCTDKSPKTS